MDVRSCPVVISIGLTATMLFAAIAAAQSAEQPYLRVESDTVDVGKVIAGKYATATYVFHNDGLTDITILRASPS